MKKIIKKILFKGFEYVIVTIVVLGFVTFLALNSRDKKHKKTCSLTDVWSKVEEKCMEPKEAAFSFAETLELYKKDGYNLYLKNLGDTKQGNKYYIFSFKINSDREYYYNITVYVTRKNIYFKKYEDKNYKKIPYRVEDECKIVDVKDKQFISYNAGSEKIKKLREEMGEDDFYTMTDDYNYYNSLLIKELDEKGWAFISVDGECVELHYKNEYRKIRGEYSNKISESYFIDGGIYSAEHLDSLLKLEDGGELEPSSYRKKEKQCYLDEVLDKEYGNSIHYIEVNFKGGNIISGIDNWMPAQKDWNTGIFEGEIKKNIIEVISHKEGEGSFWELEGVYRLHDDSISVGHYDLDMYLDNGIYKMTEGSKVQFYENIDLVNCDTIKDDYRNAHGYGYFQKTCEDEKVWSKVEEKCMNPKDAALALAKTSETYIQDGYDINLDKSGLTNNGEKYYDFSFKHYGDPGATYFLNVLVDIDKLYFGEHKETEYSIYNAGLTIDNLIAGGWSVEEKEYGDLNFDGKDDLAFIIYKKGEFEPEDMQPKKFAIYFYNSELNFYELNFFTNTFIPENLGQDNLLGNNLIEIDSNSILSLSSTFWTSMGSWYSSNETYKFKYDKEKFLFIGYDSSSTHRGTGEEEKYSIDFINKKMSISTGSTYENEEYNIEWRNFELDELKTLKDLSEKSWEFEDLYL